MAVPLAILAALCYGIGAVLQSRVATCAPAGLGLSPRLLLHLARQRVWLVGIGTMVLGMICQAGALDLGSLAVVEPLLVGALLFALPIGAALARQHLGRREWAAAIATAAGLAALLAISSPSRGKPDADAFDWILVGAVVGGVVAVLVLARRFSTRPGTRAALLGVGGGILLGLQDAMTKSAFDGIDLGLRHLLLSWQPYGLLVTAVYGLTLIQAAYRCAPLAAAFPAVMISQPLAGVLIGVTCFGEQIRFGTWPMIGSLAAAVVMIVGAHSLARSPLVTQQPAVRPGDCPPPGHDRPPAGAAGADDSPQAARRKALAAA